MTDTPKEQTTQDRQPHGVSVKRLVIFCIDCRWWGKKPDWLGDDDEFDPQGQIPGVGFKMCGHPKVNIDEYPDEPIEDAANSYETIGTGPKFACIHGEI